MQSIVVPMACLCPPPNTGKWWQIYVGDAGFPDFCQIGLLQFIRGHWGGWHVAVRSAYKPLGTGWGEGKNIQMELGEEGLSAFIGGLAGRLGASRGQRLKFSFFALRSLGHCCVPAGVTAERLGRGPHR